MPRTYPAEEKGSESQSYSCILGTEASHVNTRQRTLFLLTLTRELLKIFNNPSLLSKVAGTFLMHSEKKS